MQVRWSHATIFLVIGFAAFAAPATFVQPPDCEGFGSNTAGGSGKPAYRVTNLGDSGPGSLRDGISQGNRHVVFAIAGDILLASDLFVQGANLTIDGLTAPPPGMTLRSNGLVISGDRGAHDVIVRGIRIRGAGSGADRRIRDGINISRGAYNVVIDRVSVYGSEDGNLDITEARDVTVCWSIVAKPAGSERNMLIKYDPSRITLHHNLFLNARQRNPHVRIDDVGTPATETTLDMRNNVIWNWRGGYGTQIGYGSRVNIVNNFYSNRGFSSNDRKQAIIVCKGECDGNRASSARAYVAGNFSNDGFTDYINSQGTESVPFPAPPVDTTDSHTGCGQVLARAGVRPLDWTDQEQLSRVSCE